VVSWVLTKVSRIAGLGLLLLVSDIEWRINHGAPVLGPLTLGDPKMERENVVLINQIMLICFLIRSDETGLDAHVHAVTHSICHLVILKQIYMISK